MKNIILFLLISITLLCCTSKQDESILLFNKISFKINNAEEVVKIDTKKKEIFKSYFDKNDVQIPLFRCIKSDRYLIFIGIPFNTTLKELTDFSLAQSLKQTFFEGDSTSYFYKTYRNEKEQMTAYARNFSNNLVYVLTVTNSTELSDSLFSAKELSTRFKQ
jgi:hypothetical protein